MFWYVLGRASAFSGRLRTNSEMSPRIGTSVRALIPDLWMLGSSIVCERASAANHSSAIISWEDEEGPFNLRERIEEDGTLVQDSSVAPGLVHEAGTSAAVWSIGTSTICKVKAWCEGMEPECDTIRFVAKHAPNIRVPEVIYSWVDHQ